MPLDQLDQLVRLFLLNHSNDDRSASWQTIDTHMTTTAGVMR